jgi:hypothetical protein
VNAVSLINNTIIDDRGRGTPLFFAVGTVGGVTRTPDRLVYSGNTFISQRPAAQAWLYWEMPAPTAADGTPRDMPGNVRFASRALAGLPAQASLHSLGYDSRLHVRCVLSVAAFLAVALGLRIVD